MNCLDIFIFIITLKILSMFSVLDSRSVIFFLFKEEAKIGKVDERDFEDNILVRKFG